MFGLERGELALINKEMTIEQVLREYPEAEGIFKRYGIKCFG